MTWFAGSGALVGLLVGMGLAWGQAQVEVEPEPRHLAARAALVAGLEGYADWCQGQSLFKEKQEVFELVLELDSENAEARKVLGYKRTKDGGWQAPSKPKVYRNFDKKALVDAPARRQVVTDEFVQALIGLLESGTLEPAQEKLVVGDALRFDPDNERLHTLLGEVQSDKGWVLPETQRAKARRAELRGFVLAAFENAAPAAPAPLLEREKGIRLKLEAVAAPRVRVVGTADEAELLLTAQAVQALEPLLQAVFDSTYHLPADCTIFMLSDPGHLEAFLANHPAITPEQRAFYGKLEGGGIHGTNDFAFWTGNTQRRIDGIVRLVLGFWLSGAFEVTVDNGWIYEGLGLVLTRSLVRTRMTWLAQPSTVLAPEQDVALRQRLLDPATNWMDEVLRLLQEGRQPALPELFSKGASQLTTEDVLYSYALATYLLEARPEVLPRMLGRMGTGYSRTQAFSEALDMGLGAFEEHFGRWLRERN